MGTLIDITPQLGPQALQERRQAHRRRREVLAALSHLRCVVEAARGLLVDRWDDFEHGRLEHLLEGSDVAVKRLRDYLSGP